MCVKPMEENEDDKVVNMIINYFSARVNIVERPRAANRALFSFGYPFIIRIVQSAQKEVSDRRRKRRVVCRSFNSRSLFNVGDPVSLSVALFSSISAVKFPFVSPRASALLCFLGTYNIRLEAYQVFPTSGQPAKFVLARSS